MPLTPIDQAIKDETIVLVQQNMSLTQITAELQKRGKNVSRSWVANMARKYRKAPQPLIPQRPVGAPPPQQTTTTSTTIVNPVLETGPIPAVEKASVPTPPILVGENGLVQNPTGPGLEVVEAEMVRLLDQQRDQLDLREQQQDQLQQQQDQRDQQLTQRETQLQQQIASYDKEKKAHQRKELLLNSRFQDLLLRENNVSRYGPISIHIEEMGFMEDEILNFFMMVRNRAETTGQAPHTVLIKIIQEFADEEDVQSRLYNKQRELAAANQNIMMKQILMLS